MKAKRALLMLITISLILVLGGCTKKWSVNFVTARDIDDWYRSGTYELISEGLIIPNGSYITAPYYWSGDFTITVKFKLAATDVNRNFCAIWVGSSPYWRPLNIISFPFYYGGGLAPQYDLWTDGEFHDEEKISSSTSIIPGMVNNEINTWVMSKTGGYFKVTLNDAVIAEWINDVYDSGIFHLSLNSVITTGDEVVFKSVSVEYENGNMSPVF